MSRGFQYRSKALKLLTVNSNSQELQLNGCLIIYGLLGYVAAMTFIVHGILYVEAKVDAYEYRQSLGHHYKYTLLVIGALLYKSTAIHRGIIIYKHRHSQRQHYE